MKKLSVSFAALVLSAGLASAADFGGAGSLKDDEVRRYNWTGFYAGVHAGYGFADINLSEVPSLGDGNGFFGGLQVGANYQAGRWLFGLETDVSFANMDASRSFDVSRIEVDVKSGVSQFGTVRGRLGHVTGPFLLYATGGLAWGRARAEGSAEIPVVALAAVAPTELSASGSSWHVGYAIGGGLEYMITPNWTMKAEYLYVDLGKEKYAITGDLNGSLDQNIDFHTVRLGLNYQF